jgi:Skp family chaperone for outer membrane proteins
LEKNFNQVSEIVQDWSKIAGIDLVLNKTQTLFVDSKLDATESIIEVLKNRNLYQEYKESELLSQETE